MRALGLVAWTPLPGSLHVVPDEQLVGDHIDPAQEREPVVHVGAPTTVTVQFPRAPDYNVVTLGQLVTGDGGFVLLNDEQLQAMPMPERRKYYGNKGAWQRKQNRLSGPDASR